MKRQLSSLAVIGSLSRRRTAAHSGRRAIRRSMPTAGALLRRRRQAAQLPAADGVAQRLMRARRRCPQWWQAYQIARSSMPWSRKASATVRRSAAAQSTLKAAREALRSQIGNSHVAERRSRASTPRGSARSAFRCLPQQQTFLYNVFAAQVQASYTLRLLRRRGARRPRAWRARFRQQAFQLEATRRALATNIVVGGDQRRLAAGASSSRDGAARRSSASSAPGRPQRAIKLGSASHDDMLAAEAGCGQRRRDAAGAARAGCWRCATRRPCCWGARPTRRPSRLPLDALHLPETVPVSVPSESAASAAGHPCGGSGGARRRRRGRRGHGLDVSVVDAVRGLRPRRIRLVHLHLAGGRDLERRRHRSRSRCFTAARWSPASVSTRQLYEAAVSQYRQTVLAAFQKVADTLVSLEEDAHTAQPDAARAAAARGALQQNTESRYKLGPPPFYATPDRRSAVSERASTIYSRARRSARRHRRTIRLHGQPTAGHGRPSRRLLSRWNGERRRHAGRRRHG